MALTHVDSLARNGLANYIVDQLDSGHLVFTLADGSTEVATIDLAATAFGAASSGTATMLGVPLSDSTATGNASPVTKFLMQDSDPAEVFRGSVGATSSGEDIELSSTTIGTGDTVTITAFTYSASA